MGLPMAEAPHCEGPRCDDGPLHYLGTVGVVGVVGMAGVVGRVGMVMVGVVAMVGVVGVGSHTHRYRSSSHAKVHANTPMVTRSSHHLPEETVGAGRAPRRGPNALAVRVPSPTPTARGQLPCNPATAFSGRALSWVPDTRCGATATAMARARHLIFSPAPALRIPHVGVL